MEEMKSVLKRELHCVSPAREEALLAEAGFTGTELFFAGLSWRGWITYAG
jgi:tRNA (cmo5U34)-methyltransferase